MSVVFWLHIVVLVQILIWVKLEYIYKRAGSKRHLRTTCMFAVIYVILGNLSGNAVAFGIYVLEAAGIEGHESAIRGLAVACLTVACLLHASWRQGGIIVNNLLALLKVSILLAVVGIGFAASAGASFGHGPVHGVTVNPDTGKSSPNFDTHSSFANPRKDAASYAESLLFIVYTYSGYEQPFYVLSEVSRPKKIFAKSTIAAMSTVGILFVLVNVSYLCAVSFDKRLDSELDMATVFFREVFGNDLAPRVMSGIIAFSIFGNIVVMTFTASRVKQEIAKEGVLPFSLFFARSTTTPIGSMINRFWPSNLPDSQVEQSPVAALFLHWMFSMIMIGATSGTIPDVAYDVLVSLYSYSVVILVGFFVSSGLLYLRYFSQDKDWVAGAGFKPWGGPTAAIIYSVTCAFLLIAAFLPPSEGSYFAKSNTGIEWYIVPTVGLATLLLGYAYYLVFEYLIPYLTDKVLVVDRDPTIVYVDGEWVQAFEIVEACWEARPGPETTSANAGFELQRVDSGR